MRIIWAGLPGRGLGERVEVKNLNSMKAMLAAMNHEYQRQVHVLTTGGRIDRETRSFDAANNATVRLRSKEELLDYRFFPDPDLPPLHLPAGMIDAVRAALPELPEHIATRYRDVHGLTTTETVRRGLRESPQPAVSSKTS